MGGRDSGSNGGLDAVPDRLECPTGQTACDGQCRDLTMDPANCGACGTACMPGMVCVMGSCQMNCGAGQTVCGTRCVNLQTDSNFCGSCGNACAAGQVCNAGRCDISCGGMLTTCGGAGGGGMDGGADGGEADGGAARYCADTRIDPRNCGACGRTCDLPNTATSACAEGACAVLRCAMGFADCNGMASDGCETNVRGTDADNCGGCGVTCRLPNATATCAMGACALGTCAMGFADCDMMAANGCEASVNTDNANCGMCGRACMTGQVCSAGACGASCGAGTTNCSGDCVNTQTDPAHCGMCGTACRLPNASVNACVAGACIIGGCNAGFGDCDGMAANGCETSVRAADANNCGGCGIVCRFANAAATCSDGACAMGACAAGFADCDMSPANGCETNTGTDNANCGMCGRACMTGQVCSAGMCGASCGGGTTNCSGDCVNTQTDPANCGMCGTACRLANTSVNACVRGACVVGGCAMGFADCDGMAANGCETTVRGTDANNCGGCGVVCRFANARSSCNNGACELGTCSMGFSDCDMNPANGCEASTGTDAANCGMCGRACAAGQVCAAGMCTTTCGAGTTNCSGACVNTNTDSSHCGMCGNACRLANVSVNACSGGACVVGGCSAGFADCDSNPTNGCETSVRGADANNCGGCGIVCRFANAGASCNNGMCAMGSCNAGFADCDMNPANGCETNTRTDNGSCGMCGRSCAAGQVCAAGVCSASCGGGTTNCSGDCVNTQTDPANCGMCGTVCRLANASVNACTGGMCLVGGCNLGFADCDSNPTNGCETSVRGTDANNCGGCGVVCRFANAGATCANGVCALGTCAAGFADCDMNPANGCEVDTRTSNTNCGRCTMACSPGQVCGASMCTTTCGAGTTNCSGACVNTQTDPAHCGMCGTACRLPNVSVNACTQGACVIGGCSAGFADCDANAANGCETNVRGADANNCGGCGVVCRFANAGATCNNGTCTLGACAAGFANCDANPANGCETNVNTDNANCGRCANACAAGQVCGAGMCATTCGTGTTNCSGACVNTNTDASHCGRCGNACRLPNVSVNACVAGACIIGGCSTGFADCDANPANGCETNVRGTDANNCGGCGIVCRFANAGATCNNGTCALGTCAAGFANCDNNPANGCEVNTNTDNNNCSRCANVCASGQVCASGMCTTTCGAGTTNCSGACVNTNTDPSHCGGCGSVCRLANVSVNTCASGTCGVGTCSANFGNCDSVAANGCETDLRTSTANCSACGRACAFANAAASCASSACVLGACNAGFGDCDGNAANGCETNTGTSNAHCGACNRACAAGQVCAAGVCTLSCGGGTTNCSGACVNTSTDPRNCGGCGMVCNLANVGVHVCAANACGIGSCASGFANCNGTVSDGCEVNTTTSTAHCGACNRACATGQTCSSGACVCPSGQALCSGACINVTTDVRNCGGCGVVCATGQSCTGGSCACPAGQTVCAGACVNTSSNTSHCGACGRACATGQMCTSGACTGGGPANDLPANAIMLTGSPGVTVTGNTTGSTNQSGCGSGGDVYYRIVLTQREVVYLDTYGSAYDTQVGFATGATGNTACNDDSCGLLQSQLVQTLAAGTYFVVVSGFGGQTGAFTLHYHHLPAANGTVTTLTQGANRNVSGTTSGTGVVNVCGSGPEHMFFYVTCPSYAGGAFSFTTCNNGATSSASFDTQLSFVQGNGGTTCVDDSCGFQTTISGTVTAGAALRAFYVDGFGGQSGNYNVRYTVP